MCHRLSLLVFIKPKAFVFSMMQKEDLKRGRLSSGMLPFNLHTQASEKKYFSFNVLLLLEIQMHHKNRFIF